MSGYFIEEVCDCTIIDGNVVWQDRGNRRMVMPLRLFREQHLLHSEMLAKWDYERLPHILVPCKHG